MKINHIKFSALKIQKTLNYYFKILLKYLIKLTLAAPWELIVLSSNGASVGSERFRVNRVVSIASELTLRMNLVSVRASDFSVQYCLYCTF